MRKVLWGAATGLAAAGVATYALKIEPLRLQLTHNELFLSRLPAVWDGLSVLLLTDPHVSEWGERERRTVALCATLDAPELIVWGGDFLGNSAGIPAAARLVEEIASLFPRTPMVGVWGNAEHKISPEKRAAFQAQLAGYGLQVLVNENLLLPLRGARLPIGGCDDPYYGFADLEATFAGLDPDHFTLFLAHSPQVATLAARAGIDLMLCGHTHGGQVRLPLFGAIKTQNPLSRRLDCGAFDHARLTRVLGYDPGGDLVTYISRGIGLAYLRGMPWMAPRLNCRPEIAHLLLRRAVP